MADIEKSGILLVNKHKGVTSHDIVNKVRRLYNTKRVGHTGTLDPMATGLLIVLIGNATKASEYCTYDKKTYEAIIKFGITTDTEDITGNILSKSENLPTFDEVKKAVNSFVGNISQIPPMYSALKVNGKKLYELAREGKVIARTPREVIIYSIDVKETDDKSCYLLKVVCSGGTYIRTLCADIGQKLGCGAVMQELNRSEIADFSLANAYTISQLEEMNLEERENLLIPTEKLFSDLTPFRFEGFFEKLFKNGCEIYQKKIGADFSLGKRLSIYDDNGFYALAEVQEFEEGLAIKQIKRF